VCNIKGLHLEDGCIPAHLTSAAGEAQLGKEAVDGL
jgi:hypothetical protein